MVVRLSDVVCRVRLLLAALRLILLAVLLFAVRLLVPPRLRFAFPERRRILGDRRRRRDRRAAAERSRPRRRRARIYARPRTSGRRQFPAGWKRQLRRRRVVVGGQLRDGVQRRVLRRRLE